MPKEYLDCVAALKAEGKSEDEAQKTCSIAYYKKHGMTPQEAEKLAEFTPPESGEAPEGVRSILASVYSSCRAAWVKDNPDDKENQGNKTSCAQQAWGAVHNAGWKKDSSGKWHKKETTMETKKFAEFSFEDKRRMVQEAISSTKSGKVTSKMMLESYPWIRDMFSDRVVVEDGGKLFEYPYTVAADGAVTLGDSKPVKIAYEALAELRDIEIIKTGDHVSENGTKVTFTETDLDEFMKNAEELKDTIKPPIVVSHAEGDLGTAINAQTVGAPQVGWMDSKSLTKKKNKDGSVSLLATFKDIAKNAVDKIGTELKRVSSEFYKSYKLGDKTYGKVIRRVSFVPLPSIKDMQDVTQAHLVFGETPDQPTTWVTLSEAAPKKEEDDMTADEAKKMQEEVTRLSEQVAALVKENEDLKKAKPKADIADMDVSEMAEQLIDLTKAVAKMQEDDKAKDAKITALETERATAVTKLSEVEQGKKRDDISRFCGDLLRTGRVSPALLKLGLEKFMAGLDDNEVVKFGEGPKTYDLTELGFMKKFFMNIPKNTVVRFGEMALAKTDVSSDDAGKTAADRLSEATKKLMESDKTLKFTEAFNKAQKANPALAAEYQAELGQAAQ